MRPALVLIVAALIGGCGGHGKQPSSASPTRPGKGAMQPAATDAPFGRHDAPPSGVRGQVQYYGAGDQICGPVDPAKATGIVLDRRPLYQTQRGPSALQRPEIGETLY